MFLRARGSRPSRVLIALTGFATLAAVSACGADLSKANFPRTTVTAKPVSGAPAPDDPALAFPALRVVDTCALVSKDALASLGTAGTPSSFDLGSCSNDVTDPGGKKLHVALVLGDLVFADADASSGSVEGIPEIVRKPTGGGCSSTAVTTGGASSRGITVTTTYAGGDACPPAHTVLDNVIKAIKTAPPKLADAATPGSLIPIDPCATVDAGVASDTGNKGEPSPVGLHNCAWGDSLTLRVDYTVSPSADGSFKSIDLGGTPAFERTGGPTNAPTCEIKWQHRVLQNGQSEVVSVKYEDDSADAPKTDYCPRMVTFAKSVLSKLPKV